MEKTKVCIRCKRQLLVTDFGKDKTRRDGLFPYCAECRRASVRDAWAKYGDKYRERERIKYQTDKVRREDRKARARATYQRDPDKVKANVKRWQQANAARTHATKLGSARRRYAIDPEPIREIWRRRQALKLAASVVPYTIEQLQQKVEYWGGLCWICGAPYEAIDHVKPLNKKGLHILANLRPICTACNTRKRDHWPYP